MRGTHAMLSMPHTAHARIDLGIAPAAQVIVLHIACCVVVRFRNALCVFPTPLLLTILYGSGAAFVIERFNR